MSTKYDLEENERATYSLTCSLEVYVGDDIEESTEYTDCVTGRVLHWNADDDATEIGILHLYWIQLYESALEAFESFDALNRTTERYGRLLYPDGGDEFSQEILEQFQLSLPPQRVLILDSFDH